MICCSWHGGAALSNTKFLIHGGYDGNNALSDAFIFDIGEKQIKDQPSKNSGALNQKKNYQGDYKQRFETVQFRIRAA